MKTLTEQYRSVKKGKGPKDVFLKEAKRQFPNLVTNKATFGEASTILKQKGIISENYVDLKPINNVIERKKEGYEDAFAKFLAEAEAKAEEKKVSKEVEETEEHNYDYEDKKDPNNMIFGQIQMGYYYEMKQEKNADKTIDEIKDIVFKNLAKDPIYYTKQGQFGEDIGYTDDAPSLGPTDEPKGKYKSSGYGNLKESKILKEALNKPLDKFGQDLQKRLNALGFETKVFGGQTSVPSSAEAQILKNPKLAGMSYAKIKPGEASNTSDRDYEHIEVVVNAQKLNQLKKVKSYFQTADGNYGPDKDLGWIIKNVKKTNPGDIIGSKIQRYGDKAMLSYYTSLPGGEKVKTSPVNEIAIAGGLVTGGGFTSANYMDFYGLSEAEDDKQDTEKIKTDLDDIASKVDDIASKQMFEAEGPIHIEALVDASEAAYDAGMSTDEILEFIEQHLGLKMGD